MSGHPELTPPERLLVSLVQRPEVRQQANNASAVLTDPASRRSFLKLSRELGVEGLALNGLRGAVLPDQARKELDERWEQLRRQAMIWDLEQERVLHLISRRGITPILLKGSALRGRVYLESIERSMGDLDLLVELESIEASTQALRDGGYSPEAGHDHPFHLRLKHAHGFIVELHWGLSDPDSDAVLDVKQFFTRATGPDQRKHVPVRVPSSEDLLLHVASQNEDDGFGMLRRIVDLDRIVNASPDIDWAYVTRSARSAELDIVLAVSLRLAQLLLSTEVPRTVTTGLRLPAFSRTNLALLQPVRRMVSLPSERMPADIEAFRLWCSRTWSGRGRRLREILRSPGYGGDPGFTAGRVTLRLTKLGLYHALLYARSGTALLTRRGRRQLRFWQ